MKPAIVRIQNIKFGGREKLSYAEVVMGITNLQDAKVSFSRETYDQIERIYNSFRKDKTYQLVDSDEYLQMCGKIIEQYEQYAPFLIFDGNNQHMSEDDKKRCILANKNGMQYWEMSTIFGTDKFDALPTHVDVSNNIVYQIAEKIIQLANTGWPIIMNGQQFSSHLTGYSMYLMLGLSVVKQCYKFDKQIPSDLSEDLNTGVSQIISQIMNIVISDGIPKDMANEILTTVKQSYNKQNFEFENEEGFNDYFRMGIAAPYEYSHLAQPDDIETKAFEIKSEIEEYFDDYSNENDDLIETSIAEIATEITHLDEAKTEFSASYYNDLLQKYNDFLSQTEIQNVDEEGYQKLRDRIIDEYEVDLPFILFDGQHVDMSEISKLKCFTANDNGYKYKDIVNIYGTSEFARLKIDPEYYQDDYNNETLVVVDAILSFADKVWHLDDLMEATNDELHYYSIEIALGIAVIGHWIATHKDEYFCLVNDRQTPEDLLESILILKIAGNGVSEKVATGIVKDAEYSSDEYFDALDCEEFEFVANMVSTMYIPYNETGCSYEDLNLNDQVKIMYDQINHIFNDGIDDEEGKNAEDFDETNDSDAGNIEN